MISYVFSSLLLVNMKCCFFLFFLHLTTPNKRYHVAVLISSWVAKHRKNQPSCLHSVLFYIFNFIATATTNEVQQPVYVKWSNGEVSCFVYDGVDVDMSTMVSTKGLLVVLVNKDRWLCCNGKLKSKNDSDSLIKRDVIEPINKSTDKHWSFFSNMQDELYMYNRNYLKYHFVFVLNWILTNPNKFQVIKLTSAACAKKSSWF